MCVYICTCARVCVLKCDRVRLCMSANIHIYIHVLLYTTVLYHLLPTAFIEQVAMGTGKWLCTALTTVDENVVVSMIIVSFNKTSLLLLPPNTAIDLAPRIVEQWPLRGNGLIPRISGWVHCMVSKCAAWIPRYLQPSERAVGGSQTIH